VFWLCIRSLIQHKMDKYSPGVDARSPDLVPREPGPIPQPSTQRALEEPILSLKDTLRTLKFEDTKASVRARRLQEKNASLDEAICTIQAEAQQDSVRIQQLEEQNATLDETLGTLKSETRQRSAKLEKQIASLEATNQQLSERIHQLETSLRMQSSSAQTKESGSSRRKSAPDVAPVGHEPTHGHKRKLSQQQQSPRKVQFRDESASRGSTSANGISHAAETRHESRRIIYHNAATYLAMVATLEMATQAQHLPVQRPVDCNVLLFKSVMSDKKGQAIRTYEYIVHMGSTETHLGAPYLSRDWIYKYKTLQLFTQEGFEMTIRKLLATHRLPLSQDTSHVVLFLIAEANFGNL
jgi:hypothetical protein